jgi:hypothetical protein
MWKRFMRTAQERAKESRSVKCNYMVLNGVLSSEHLANRLLLFTAGRDPKTELKEPTKSQ